MSGPWVTEAELKSKIASMTKRSSIGELQSYWDEFIHDGLEDSTNDIMTILLGKGYTSSQIDSWDNRFTYNRDIALYHAFIKAAALADYNLEGIDRLDRRKMLEEASAIMIGGVMVAPGADDAAGMATGGISEENYTITLDTKF